MTIATKALYVYQVLTNDEPSKIYLLKEDHVNANCTTTSKLHTNSDCFLFFFFWEFYISKFNRLMMSAQDVCKSGWVGCIRW